MASVRGRLYDSGYFFDPVGREVETEFLPWLRQETLSALNNVATARSVPSSSSTWCSRHSGRSLASQSKQHDNRTFVPSGGRRPASQRLQAHSQASLLKRHDNWLGLHTGVAQHARVFQGHCQVCSVAEQPSAWCAVCFVQMLTVTVASPSKHRWAQAFPALSALVKVASARSAALQQYVCRLLLGKWLSTLFSSCGLQTCGQPEGLTHSQSPWPAIQGLAMHQSMQPC